MHVSSGLIIKPVKRFGISYFAVYCGSTLLATHMSEAGARAQVQQLTGRINKLAR